MNNILESFGTLIENSMLLAPLIALAGGLLTAFTPCCLSSIPLIIAYVSNTSDDPKKSLRISLVFALGSVVTYTTLGVLATIFGKILHLHFEWWYMLLALILIIMVLQLWNVINIIPQNNLLSKNVKKGYIGAFITGILAGLFSSPCSTPVLVVLLAIVSAANNILYGIFLLLLYAIGHSTLIIIAGTSIGFINKLMHSKNYEKISKIIKGIFGSLILVLAFYMFYLGI